AVARRPAGPGRRRGVVAVEEGGLLQPVGCGLELRRTGGAGRVVPVLGAGRRAPRPLALRRRRAAAVAPGQLDGLRVAERDPLLRPPVVGLDQAGVAAVAR